MFKIGEFSKFTKVSARMLRHYDEVGLFKPIKIDNLTGYRYYSSSQIKELSRITTFRDVGFNISEIAQLIEMENDEEISKELRKKQLQIQNNINIEKKIICDIDKIISGLGKELFTMSYEVKLKSIPSCKVLSTRAILKDYSEEAELWAKLGEFAINNQLQPTGSPFAIYQDGEYKENNVDIEVAMPVKELQENSGDFVFREVKAIPCMATILYKGPYEDIDEAFFFLANWIENSEYEPYGNVRQVAIKGEWNESNPNNYLVEIQMPIKK